MNISSLREIFMFDIEEAGFLLEDVGDNSPGICSIELNLDVNRLDISEEVFFTSVFAYALSRFIGNEKILFYVVDDNSSTFPLLVDCKNQDISSFIDSIIESIDYCQQNQIDAVSDIIFNFKSKEITSGDFNANFIRNDDNYTLNIRHSEKYSKETINRFLNSFKLIAQDFSNVNELKDIAYTSSSDLDLLDSFNQTDFPLKYDDILDAFNDNLLKCPDNKLVSFKERVYTYSEGAFIADEIAQRLINLGVKPQDNVAFLTERSEWYVFNILAILSLGAIYVPLDNNLPDERVDFIVGDTVSKVLIVSDETYERAKNLSNEAIILNVSDILENKDKRLSPLDVNCGNVACVLYTSGTTGVPKGINITRKSILNVCDWYVDKYDLSSGDVYGLFASIGFDVASFNINVVMYSGACLSIAPEDYKIDMLKLNEYFIEQSVNHAWITTQVGKLFMQSVEDTSLDILMVGGEKLGDIKNPENFTLIDVCGPTEAFEHISSIKNVEKVDSSSIGHLNYNTKAYVLDDEGRRVPMGAVGELYISGYQIAEGYLNNETKTKEAFLDNPFDDTKGHEVLYRTGDMVRILPDGSIGIVGRRDSQVKIRGNRVELSEVESVIRETNYVEDVTVQTIKNRDNNELVAYVVPAIEADNLEEIISEYISISKPDYMVPSYIIQLDSIPLNINGKVDKKSLPKVDLSSLHENYVAPTTKNEKIIVEAFEKILGQEQIGIYDDFIRLGGDSISAIHVISMLQKNGVSCNARDILNYKTPFAIAQNTHELRHVSYDSVEGEVDLLPIQSFFFDQINANQYSQEYVLKSDIELDINILQRAFDEVSKTHDMLRAIYKHSGNNIIQEIRSVDSCVCEIDEVYVENADLNQTVGEILLESNGLLDISKNLIKITLLHHEGTSYVIFVIHHLIIDGVSWSILIEDLTYFYILFLENKEGNLLKPYPYKNWVEDVNNLALDISESEKQHWIEVNNAIDDSLIKGKSNFFAFNVGASFDSKNLLMLSEEEFLALSIARAYKKTYGEDIIFNKESYGRDEELADVNRTIGWFTTQFPVQVKVNDKYDPISLIEDVYGLKVAFKDVEHLGANYGSLIYGSHELEFKHCPVTLNFLSNEFVFKNEIFESLDSYLSSNEKIDLRIFESVQYGINIRISHVKENYVITGSYAEGTYLGDKFDEFVDNIKYELDFIGNYQLENITSLLSESQLSLYLDEKVRDMGNAYTTNGIFECPPDKSIDEIKESINKLVEKHPILKGRVIDGDNPLLVCDSYPLIDVVKTDNCSELIKPFNLDEYLARFYIIENDDANSIFFDIHHIISDGTNCHLVLDELNNIFENNFDDALDLGFVYNSNDDFESKYKSIYREAHEFYSKNLSDLDEVDMILFDDYGSKSRIKFPIRGIKNDVRKFCHEKGITVGNLLNAVFAYTYSRFTGKDKVYYTYVQHGRHEPYAQKAFGMFARLIPVIADCSNTSVENYIANISDLILDSMKYSVYPYRLLAKEFDIGMDPSFEYNYNLNDVSDVENDLIVEDLDLDLISEFGCFVNDLDDGYLVRIDSCDKYSNELIIRFLEAFKEILIQILDKENLSDIGYLSNSDLELLDSYNQTEHDLDYEDILDAFNDNLSECSNNKLVSCNDKVYDYGEGAYIADKIAKKLVDLGIEPQDCVSFLVERSEYYMFSVLGILSVGAIYVPLDDENPDERIQFILTDTESKVVIVSDGTYERAKNLIDDDVVILNISAVVNEDKGSLSRLPVIYGDLASILYTSGTTGVPKGVKIPRKAIINLAEFYTRTYGLTKDDVFGLFSAIGFDAAYKAIFAAIYAGACLDIIPKDIKLDMFALNNHFIENGVSHIDITTQVARLLISQIDNISLDVLFTGGEKLGEFDGDVNCRFVDGYGPTEAYVEVSTIDLKDRVDSSSVGHLVDNIKAYVLDNEFRRVPVGAVGELYLAGYQIAKGYLNREEETEKAFIENPFDEDENYKTLYRSGDMVRILSDGSLGIVGRRDSQVKIRGNRVELSEIESIIHELEYVYDVTVQTIKNYGNLELVAYVVASGDINNLKEKICDYVRELKPDYMVPSFVIKLDEIPLTVNGKVDRRALPEIDLNSLRNDYVAPTTENEKILVKSFETVFNQENIGIYDDFVRLGGDSISAIRLISILQKEGLSCSTRDILNYKTPYLIAKNLGDVEKVIFKPIEGEIDLHPIQEFFFDQVNKNEYSQEFILKSEIDLDLDTSQKAFDELSNIHDMLRATYRHDGDRIIQEILPVGSRVCKVEKTSVEDFERGIGHIIFNSNRSLDIGNELIKITIVHHEDECYVVFVIHHLIIDGISWSILIDDLTEIYISIKQNSEIDILRPYPYNLWVEDVKKLASNISENEKQHWLTLDSMWDDSLIKGKSTVFALNIDSNFNVDNQLRLTEEEYLGLGIARAYKKTYGMDIIFNRESHGRDELVADVTRTVGWFTSQFPVNVNVNCQYDDISLIRDVCALKNAFKNLNHLGLNYGSLVYITHDLKYKHCPVTFNFLSSEFTFKNRLFESLGQYLADKEIKIDSLESVSYGISFNIYRLNQNYIISGDYPENTYLADKFDEFVENIERELDFIGKYVVDDIVCPLSESQLGIYLDEKVNDMGTAYSAADIFKCDSDKTIDEIKSAINCLIERHPILKSRIVDGEIPLLVCDSYPSIEVIDTDDYSTLIKPFDLDKSLMRFFIIENNGEKSIFFDMHHIISDATTCMLILNELGEIFEGNVDDSIDVGFGIESFNSFESKFKPSYEKAHEFYRKNLSDIDEVDTLLFDNGGSKNSIRFPIRDIKKQVEEFSHKCGVTVGNILNAVFAYTYSRFTGKDKVYYNYTQHGRHEPYAQKALGMFVRTIPIIVDCSNSSINEYLTTVSDLILDSMKHSVYPYRLLANEFDLKLNVAFEYNYDLNDVSDIGNDLVIEDLDIDLISDFVCVVNDLDDGYSVRIDSCDKYSDELIIRFIKAFKEILIQILDKENLSDIDYLSKSDLKLLEDYNQTAHDLKYYDILDAFNDNLSKNPDNRLVSFNEISYSYGEGAFIADKIAKQLIDSDVKRQDSVAFLVERSELYLLATLGIMSIGAVYVPLDTALPDEQIKFILDDTDSKAIIVSDKTYNRACDLTNGAALLNVNEIIKDKIESLSNLPVSYGDLACILYTSGTTGIPKGVEITRKSVLNLVTVYKDKYGLSDSDVYGLFSTIGFDAALLAMMNVLYSGACLSVVPEDIRLDIGALNDYFIRQNVTHTLITSQVGKMFMQNVDDTSLEVLLVGGEKLGEVESPEGYTLVDAFGPTEACVFISSIENSQKLDSSSIGPLGYNTKAYILDDEFRRIPIGAVGELYLTGYQIAKGYLNRDEETRNAFIDNPFDDDENYKTLYRSGDMVRVLSDGSLAIVGRRDSQVKIRGNRVELSEIESVIRELDYIEDVTAQTVKNGTNNELVAYVVVSGEIDDIKDYVCNHVAENKPAYMIPSFVIELDAIPLNINGKVDRRALPNVDASELQSEYVAPSNDTEKAIVEAFENAFNKGQIGVFDDFTKLGGDSLTAIKIVSSLSKTGIKIDSNAILKYETPLNIAQYVGDNQDNGGFVLVKEGNDNQNMFLLPSIEGLSAEYSNLIQNIDFDGNIYVIDDFKYGLSSDELKKTNHEDNLNYYYYAIKDLFQDGDIIVGYSLGCMYATLIAERLEKDKQIDKCILIDGSLSFVNTDESYREEIMDWIKDILSDKYSKVDIQEIIDKVLEVTWINSRWEFHTPKIESNIVYLSTSESFEANLNAISDNYECILVDSTHLDIIDKDIDKIVKYFR